MGEASCGGGIGKRINLLTSSKFVNYSYAFISRIIFVTHIQ